MTDFQYADQGDRLTQELIESEYDAEYWGVSEDLLLARAEDYLRRRCGDALGGMTLLDLGCGTGRLMPRFARLFGHIVGLEPDAGRCAEAAETIAEAGLNNAEAIHSDLGEYLQAHPGVRFDAVLCSHIFQHISHELFIGILRDLEKCTDKDTSFLFTTTYIAEAANQYSKEYFGEDGKRTMALTDYAGFLEAIGQEGVLPVCRFSRPWMEKLLLGYGLKTELFSAYHFADEHDAEADVSNNASAEKLKKARDAMYICSRIADGGALAPDTLAGKVCFMQYYHYEGQAPAPSGSQNAPVDARTERIRSDFQIAEGFLLSGDPHFKTERYYLADVPLRLENVPILDSHVVLSVYPEVSVCQVSVCLQVGEASVQDYVYLHQLQCSPAENFRSGTEKTSVPALCDKLLRENGFTGVEKGATGCLLEINRFGDKTDAASFSEHELQCLYGLLTGDEGWRHVPGALARERMAESWTSRDFVKVIAFSNSYLLVNLNRSCVHEDYLAGQYGYQHRYYNGMNDYFTMDAATAGVNHGVFFSAETGLIIKTATDRLMQASNKRTKLHGIVLNRKIEENKTRRAELIRMLNKVENVKISELGELDGLILRQLDVSQRVESIRNLLELLESDLDLLYSTDTNRMVTFLTILGLAFALIQIILGVIPLL